MARIDLSTYLADDTLTLDGVPSAKYPQNAAGTGGKSYEVPSLSGEDGLRLQRILNEGSGDLDQLVSDETTQVTTDFLTGPDGKQLTMREKLLGSALAEMVADGVSNNTFEALMGVIVTQASSGTEMARMFVNRAAGEAVPPNRAARRAAKKQPASAAKAGSKSSATSGASRTRSSRTSTSGSSTAAAKTPRAAKTA